MAITHIGNNIYLGLDADTKPTNVPTGSIFIATDARRIYHWDGDSWEESAYASIGAADERTLVREGGAVIGVGVGRAINFTTGSDFDITEDTGNDEYDIKIADNAIGDNHIAAHTSTKITIDDSDQLPDTVAYTDQSNVFTSGNTFEVSNIFVIQNQHNRIASTPSDPPADTGLRYLIQIDTNNDSFADKVKIGGSFKELRDF